MNKKFHEITVAVELIRTKAAKSKYPWPQVILIHTREGRNGQPSKFVTTAQLVHASLE